MDTSRAVLASWDGKVLNTAAISRELGVCRRSCVAVLRTLERQGRLSLLPFHGSGGKSLLYMRESFRGLCVAAIIKRMREIAPESRFSWWKTGRVRRIDLVAATAREQIGFEFTTAPVVNNRDWWPLRIAYRRGLIDRGFVLYPGDRAFVVGAVALGLPLDAFFDEMDAWILVRRTVKESRDALDRINESRCRACSPGRWCGIIAKTWTPEIPPRSGSSIP
jgi:hypothetical protein